MGNILLKRKNNEVLNKLANRSLKSRKNTVAIWAISLATLLFTGLFTIAVSLQQSMQDSNMRTSGTFAHAGIKHITVDEYEKIAADHRIRETGHSIIIGYAVGDSFSKVPTEVRWADENYAEWTFNNPVEGKLPENINEIATSRIVLDAMGVAAEVGTEIELTYSTDTEIVKDTFTVCGIWEGDPIAYRQTIFLSESYTKKIAPAVHGVSDDTVNESTGYVDCVIMFPTEWNITKQAETVMETYGLRERVNINGAYSTAVITVATLLPVAAGALVVFVAGYLLIYNVFYISIAQDIRFYGMLKTLGTTSGQVRKIVYKKAVTLSCVGIPIGLLIGWPVGRLLLPYIVNILTENMRVVTTVNPLIFVVAVVFSLITVFISCRKPAKMAAKVSPMEALRYIEQSGSRKKKKRTRGINTFTLAKENLGRNPKKVMIVTLSFSLSVVLLNSVYTYVTSFDFDKFVADFSLTDFTVSDASIINSNSPFNTASVSLEFCEQIETLEGLENKGNIFLQAGNQPLDSVALDEMKRLAEEFDEIAAEYGNFSVRKSHGCNIYGIDDWPAEFLQVLEGEIDYEQWHSGDGICVTPMRMIGDGTLSLYHPGDSLTIMCEDGKERTYTVLAIVLVPRALANPLSMDMGVDFVLSSREFMNIVRDEAYLPMKTFINVDDENIDLAETRIKNYITNKEEQLDYYSKATLRRTFQTMIDMYRIIGGTLCVILAMIGILNFINSMTTSILARQKEIAMLQSVGMTGRQVLQMLICEGMGYSVLGVLSSVILSFVASVTIVKTMGAELSYFSWNFTLLPVFLAIIPLVAITVIVPVICYRKLKQKPIVERLKVAEA